MHVVSLFNVVTLFLVGVFDEKKKNTQQINNKKHKGSHSLPSDQPSAFSGKVPGVLEGQIYREPGRGRQSQTRGLHFSHDVGMWTAQVLMSPRKNSRHKCPVDTAWGYLAGSAPPQDWAVQCGLFPRPGCPLAPLAPSQH